MRPRLDTADGVNSSMQSSSGIISASSSSHNLTIARPGEKSLVRTGSGVHFGTAESRSRSNSEAVPLEPVSPPQQSPALSQHKATVITSSSSMSTSANTAANSVAQRVTFNTGANRVLDEHLSVQQLAFLAESKLLFTCGHWELPIQRLGTWFNPCASIATSSLVSLWQRTLGSAGWSQGHVTAH